jgi:hypothetical protein
MGQVRLPVGWDEARVERVLTHYQQQTEDEAVEEDESAFAPPSHTLVKLPVELLPAVRELIARNRPRTACSSPLTDPQPQS